MEPKPISERKKASDFPQELLNIFDLYVHGDIDRRGFLDRAQKFAVGGVTAAMLLDSLAPNYAWAQQVPPNDPRIRTERVTVPSPQGNGEIKGLFAKPANQTGRLPGVLVVHENRGLNPYIEDVARRLATANFMALAPDGLTSVGGYTGDETTSAAKFREVNGQKMGADFEAAARWLKARSDCTGKIGAVGFCFGGGVVNTLAVALGADLAAAVPYYGRQPQAADVPRIKAALLIHYASNDQGINNGWAAFETALKANNVTYTMHMYENTQHGFHNDTTPRYDEAAAKLSWQRTLDHFNKYLRG
jgi:carboxymethylenebutenolidase